MWFLKHFTEWTRVHCQFIVLYIHNSTYTHHTVQYWCDGSFASCLDIGSVDDWCSRWCFDSMHLSRFVSSLFSDAHNTYVYTQLINSIQWTRWKKKKAISKSKGTHSAHIFNSHSLHRHYPKKCSKSFGISDIEPYMHIHRLNFISLLSLELVRATNSKCVPQTIDWTQKMTEKLVFVADISSLILSAFDSFF